MHIGWSATILEALFSISGVAGYTDIVRMTFFERVLLLLFLDCASYTDAVDLSSSVETQL
jgi:hypothetical protein